MTDNPIISVCIANYNGAGMIAGCIDSVLAQEGAFVVEILVHDDASTDGSADLVARDYPAVRLIRSESNVGFCVSNNRMVAEARGEYILLLNNDAELFPDALQALLKEAGEIDQPAILSLPQYDYLDGKLIDRGCFLDPFFNPVPNMDPLRQDVAMVIGACLWLPKRMWEEIGGFPEWFGSIAEDMYICCRARLAGCAVRVLGNSGYLHRAGQSFGGGVIRGGQLVSTIRRRRLSERNKTFVMAIICPAPFLQMVLPIHMAILIFEGMVLSVLKGNSMFFREIYWPIIPALYRYRIELKHKRKVAMCSRQISVFEYFSVFCLLPYKLKMFVLHGLPNIGSGSS